MNKNKVLLFLFLFTFTNSCVRFKVDNLKSSVFVSLKLGSSLDSIQGMVVNKAMTNLPSNIPVYSNRIYIVDYYNSLIKVFNNTGKLEYIVGNPSETSSEDVKILYQNFSSLGGISLTEDENIYIQNMIKTEIEKQEEESEEYYDRRSGEFKITEIDIVPSYILHINKQGKLASVIGLNGENSEPFRYIEDVFAYSGDKLFVLHRYATQMVLSYYKESKLEGSLYENSLDVLSEEEKKKYKIRLDSMIPYRTGEYALVCISYFSNDEENRFKFKKVFQFQFNSNTPLRSLIEIKNPSDTLFAILKNGDFYVWETENGNTIRFLVHDKNGNHTNNKRIEFNEPRKNWRETFIDSMDNIYSIKLNNENLELYEWK